MIVVGVVGSGKSSLIAALLGELHSQGGSLQVNCKQCCTHLKGERGAHKIKGGRGCSGGLGTGERVAEAASGCQRVSSGGVRFVLLQCCL